MGADSLSSLIDRLRASLRKPPLVTSLHRDDFHMGAAATTTRHIPAAVLVPVINRPEPGLLLTTRTAHLRNHAGQVAFPGGRIDPTDHDATAAALREAEEEIGLSPGIVEILGQTDPYRTGTGYTVSPIVGLLPPGLQFTPSPHEVADIFEVPLAHVLDATNHQLREVMWEGRNRQYYEIDFDGHRIWGATAGMLVNLAMRLQ